MPHRAWNKASLETKKRYFELIRSGMKGAAAARLVGVSTSCGSLWYLDAGSMSTPDQAISPRFFSQDDRIEIAEGLASGEPVKSIAARIGKSYQSVYREIARNTKPDGRYQPWFAHNQATVRRLRPRPRRFALDAELRRVVADKLAKRWSPAQISRWLRRRWPRRPSWHVCHETIYEAVYQGDIVIDHQTLRTGRTYRHRRGRGRSREGAMRQCTNMKSIHDRPAMVESRRQFGHWEGDLVIGCGQRSAIATLVERKSRHAILVPLRGSHSARLVGERLIEVFSELPAGLRRTLTWDQGNEMFRHEQIEHVTGVRVFFADPHSPWQRGTNENTNGLIRQYFPKGVDFDTVSDARFADVAAELNDRPRACLGDRAPSQIMQRWTRHLNTG